MKRFVRNLSFVLLLPLAFSCNQSEEIPNVEPESAELSLEEQILALPNNQLQDPELVSLYAKAMQEVLEMAQDSDFRSYVYNKTLLQDGGDYNVYLDDIVASHKSSTKFGKSISKLESLSSKIQSKENGLRPIVFFPRAETLEEQAKANKGFDVNKAMNTPIGVMKSGHYDDYSVPGYILKNKKLKYYKDVNEDDAWETDVYVIGAEERIANYCINPQYQATNVRTNCDGDGGGGGGGGGTADTRTDGRREMGGEIKIHNLNTVEHWVSGALELRVVVVSAKGHTLDDLTWTGVKRKHFKSADWYNLNAFYYNWYKSNVGTLTVEQWWELDPGNKTTHTISVPSTSTTPGTSVSITIESKDDKLATSAVQFEDKLSEVYGAGNLYFMRN